ncbi:MAG: hypothetical protein M1831_005565 [Alyxoria varia]|nr:MAG: hypothetical protein M1831_005565 [Alyxoria varia]
MAGTGVYYRDLVPVPQSTSAVSEPEKHEVSHALAEGQTASHALATVQHDQKGAAQEEHGDEVRNLGWNESQNHIPTLVGGIENEELWLLIRRFNKQLYHVKELTHDAPGNLDLNVADEDEFSPDKLRATAERLYMTVGISMISFGKHIVRLRSWNETRRTACFCAAYFVAWAFDFIVPLLCCTLIALVVYPPARSTLFPPAPIALVSGKTGGLQKPAAGVLGSHDSATGAPENYKGEAVEQEASNFVNGIAHVALSSATGKHPQSEGEDDEGAPGDSAPDPTAMAVKASEARVSAKGDEVSVSKDKTKQPMEAKMWNAMRPLMHGLQDFADNWERLVNALSPTPPFPRQAPRLRLASLIVPLLSASIFITSYMYMKGVMFGVGFGFFGDPVIARGIALLNERVPNWQKLLELRNTLLKGIPTNAQLTLTLLRIGEANKAPLPPPPQTGAPPPERPAEMSEGDLASAGADAPLGASHAEIKAEAAALDTSAKAEVKGSDVAASKEHKHGKKGSRVLGFFKSSAKGTIETAIGADRLKAQAGSTAAKNRLGVLPKQSADLVSGPIDFKCRHLGKKGNVYISSKATIPCVSFTKEATVEEIGSQEREDLHPVWSIAIADIKDIRKIGGFGWKAKLVVSWTLDRQIADGMEITNKQGITYKVTAMPLRDELFNRLIAMGGQKWESW